MARSSTTFQLGNPGGGRKKLPEDIVALCREFTVEVVERLKEIARMRSEDPVILGVHVRAINELLNRGWGTAPQVVTLQGDVTIRIETPLTRSDRRLTEQSN